MMITVISLHPLEPPVDLSVQQLSGLRDPLLLELLLRVPGP